jgi:Flp pilus assembly pilin Flp
MANAMMVRLHNWLANLRDREEGQGLVEYVVLISLLLVLILAAVALFEDDIKKQFEEIGNRIGGIDP